MAGLLSKLPTPQGERTHWPWTTETDPAIYSEKSAWPKITIITPSFNQGKYIEETIRSVLLQNYPNLEYIIMDGGSSDNTLEIIKKYEPWITSWTSRKDDGQSDAINKGVNLSGGELFNWLNSDDYYTPSTLHAVAVAFVKNEATEVVCGAQNVFNSKSSKMLAGTNIEDQIEKLAYWGHIDQPCTFFRMNSISSSFPLNKELHYCMDADMWLRYILEKGLKNVVKIPDILVNFRIHENSKTGTMHDKFEEEKNFLRFRVMISIGAAKDLLEYFLKVSPFKRSLLEAPEQRYKMGNENFNTRIFLKYIKRNLVFTAYQHGDYAIARRMLSDSWFHQIMDKNYSLLKLKLLLPKFVLNKLRKK